MIIKSGARLRLEMREELRRLHHLFPMTTIYVTHDQQEALALSGRVTVLDREWLYPAIRHTS